MILSRNLKNGYKLVARKFLGYRMDPCYGASGCDVDSYAVYEATYQCETTGKTFTQQELELA